MSTSKISVYNYYKIDEAINSEIDSTDPFIIANERLTQSGTVGRFYTVLPSFNVFLSNRPKYKHCHEIMVDHINSKPKLGGRLVFDFDIKLDVEIPLKFKKQIENNVYEVLEKYYCDVDIDLIKFIWSTSQNPNKFSKHLTVKNIYFDNWITMSKIFYKLFSIEWDETYNWIHSSKLVDFQIVRKRGSLRMVGSQKINGYPLVFDDEDCFTLTDSLIRIYIRSELKKEQIITRKNILDSVFDVVIEEDQDEPKALAEINIRSDPTTNDPAIFDEIIYKKAYELYNKIHPGIFKIGKASSNVITLIRKKSANCLLSGKLHEQENAFCVIKKGNLEYMVSFGCYRFCSKQKLKYIGSINFDNEILVNPNLKRPRKKKSAAISLLELQIGYKIPT